MMNEVKKLYNTEPQYVWNIFTGNTLSGIEMLPCGLPVTCTLKTDTKLPDTLPKGRVWYSFNTEAFMDTSFHGAYNEKFFNDIREQGFSLSLLTTSRTVMKYINVLQGIREVEAGIWFSSDTAQNSLFTQRLDILRRLYFSDIYTIAYLNTEGDIADIINLAELVSGLCNRAYLYGRQTHIANVVRTVFEEHKKAVFYIEETNNALLL